LIHQLSDSEKAEISANLFPEARHVVASLGASAWHRDGSKLITASRVHSSQALALDVFGTVGTLSSRDAISKSWADALNLPSFGATTITPEFVLASRILQERKSTQVDALVSGSKASALVECKFTEPDGGSCSQTSAFKQSAGAKAPQCNGNYAHQVNPLTGRAARCALSAKGILYWQFVPEVLSISADQDHSPCPFAGGRYQWMRNLVAARALAVSRKQPFSFIVAYADGPFPMARKVGGREWSEFTELLTGTVALRAVSFQSLLSAALDAANSADALVIQRLQAWVADKVRRAAL
jgi:hypothetical protein